MFVLRVIDPGKIHFSCNSRYTRTTLSHGPEINQCKQHLKFQVVFPNASVIDLQESKLAFDGGLVVHRLYQLVASQASRSAAAWKSSNASASASS
jgi:hypothetical protein